MIRSFVGAFLWFLALWWAGTWLEAYFEVPEKVGLLAGLIVAGLFVGYGLRLAFTSRAQTPAPETVTAN